MGDWRDSIVLLTSSDPVNSDFGTGFVFHRDTTGRSFLMTCLHVVETLERPSEGGATDDRPNVLAAGQRAEVVVRGNGILDLAVLSVDALAVDGHGLPPLRLGGPAQRGWPIQTAGFTEFEIAQKSVVPRPLEGTVRDNNPVWSRMPVVRRGARSLDIEIDKEAFRELTDGYSGSPVLHPATGEVVGIMNLKWSGTKGHALCIGSCDFFDPPLWERLPGYPSGHPEAMPLLDQSVRQPAAAQGALDWLASTMDHLTHLDQLAAYLDDRRGLLFSTFSACLADCPGALAEHLAVDFGACSPRTSPLNDLVTVLYPHRFDGHGFWKALVAQITPPGDHAANETDRVLHWINQNPPAGANAWRVLYCELRVAEVGPRIPGFIAGAIADFTRLQGIRAEARVLFLFACLYEETGLGRFLDRLRAPRLRRLASCVPLGALPRLSQADIENWLARVDHNGAGGRHLDNFSLRRLREALEPLFPTDAARVRYRRARRAALEALTQATLSDVTQGDPQ